MGAGSLIKGFFREYGFALVFFFYWAWYGFMLYYMSLNPVEDTLRFKQTIELSYGFLGSSVICLFLLYGEDINYNFMFSCVISFVTRMLTLWLKYEILDSARLFAAVCGFVIFVHLLLRIMFKSKRGIYF